MPRPRTISEETRREIHRLKSEGYTIRYISSVTGVSVGSVAKIVHSNLELSEVDDIDARLSDIDGLMKKLIDEKRNLERQKYMLLADQGDYQIRYQITDYFLGRAVFHLEVDGRKTQLTETLLSAGEEPDAEIYKHELAKIPQRYMNAYITAWHDAKRDYQRRQAVEQDNISKAFNEIRQQATAAASIPESSRKQIIRTLEKSFHPDNGGRADIFRDVQKVKAMLTV